MVVRVFGQKFENEHEWEQFKEIYNVLQEKYAQKDETIYLLFNFCLENQVDVAILTENGPAIIELKSYGGIVIGDENNLWRVKSDNGEVSLGINLYRQLLAQKNAFTDKLRCLRDKGLLTIGEVKIRNIRCWGYFKKGSSYDVNQLYPLHQLWFSVITQDELLQKIGYINAGYILTPSNMDTIVAEIGLPEFDLKKLEPAEPKPVVPPTPIHEEYLVTTEVNEKILSEDNPFPFPDPLDKPDFMIGSKEYLDWFDGEYTHGIGSSCPILFVVGNPGMGKTHFLKYLDYLFYNENRFKGLFAIFEGRSRPIATADLLTTLFFEKQLEKTTKLGGIISVPEAKENKEFRQITKDAIVEYLEQRLQETKIDLKELQDFALKTNKLLVGKKTQICIAIDNVDDVIRFLTTLKANDQRGAIVEFWKPIRDLVVLTKEPPIKVLLSCTEDIYNTITENTEDKSIRRRWASKTEHMKPLSKDQVFEMVAKYLDLWARKNHVTLPCDQECIAPIYQLSIYPFSQSAIECFYNVTDKSAGEIVFVCSYCIRDMKKESKVAIVKDAYLWELMEKIRDEQSVARDEKIHIEALGTERKKWDSQILVKDIKKFETRAAERYANIIDLGVLIDSIEFYANMLGVQITNPPEIKNSYNLEKWISKDQFLKMWSYKGKKIITRYIFGKEKPLYTSPEKALFSRMVDRSDKEVVRSYIYQKKASHILIVRYWAGGSWLSTPIMEEELGYARITQEISLDEVMFKIVGIKEAEAINKADLVSVADENYVKLKETLDRLVKK